MIIENLILMVQSIIVKYQSSFSISLKGIKYIHLKMLEKTFKRHRQCIYFQFTILNSPVDLIILYIKINEDT